MNCAIKIKEAFIYGASLVYQNRDYINELNVFPVPDGDTGTNMSMTLKSAVESLDVLQNETIKDVCKAIASGTLRGARGNSGVITSQILRGFTDKIKDLDEIDINTVFEAIVNAKEIAYKAVVTPKEGTILTVIRALAEASAEFKNKKIGAIEKIEKIVAKGDEALAKTPEMLPILKEAGVVDSGGQGLMYFVHGVLSYFKGEKIEVSFAKKENVKKTNINVDIVANQDIKFGYCTECIINSEKGFKKNAESEITEYLSKIGDSLVVVGDEKLIKIHVHTNHPGKVFEKGLEYGFLSNLKVDNLKLEHQEKVIMDSEKKAKEFSKNDTKGKASLKDIGFVAVSSGEGLTNFFNELGCDYVISGGQTMNPSTDDFVQAIAEVNAKNVFIFPNNSNIIMAAKQSVGLVSDKKVYVVETKNVMQGINCLIYFTKKDDVKEILSDFKNTIKNLKTIQTTYAVRNTCIDGVNIKKDDFISIGDKGLLSTDKNIEESIFGAYEKIKNDADSVITIYYGEDIKEKDALKLKKLFEDRYKNVEVSILSGMQPVYYYYISIE